VQDGDGCRRRTGVTSVQAPSDTDLMRNATFIAAAGRTIRVTRPLDEIAALVACGERAVPEAKERRRVRSHATSC